MPSGEVRDTARTVPRAIALAMVGITLLYIALQMVAQGMLGAGLAQATVSPLADAAGASLGGWARSLLLVGAAISMFGYLGGMTLSIPRMVFALARDGFLPRALARCIPSIARRRRRSSCSRRSRWRWRSPARSRSWRFSPTCPRSRCISGARWRRGGCVSSKARRAGSPRALAGVVPWLACAVIVWLLTGLTRDEWIAFVACLVIATPLYLLTKKQRK